MDASVTIGLVQMACVADAEQNLVKAFDLARTAHGKGAQLVCFQELFSLQYFPARMDSAQFALAESVPGPTSARLAGLAEELGVVVVASVFERAHSGLCFNTALVFERDGRLLGKSRKMHIPEFPGYFEKYYFAPGDTDYPVFETSLLRLAAPTCWDQWYPEVARLAFLRGADLIVYPTAITRDKHLPVNYLSAWQTVMRGHAVANCLYVAAINRVGVEYDRKFPGGSFVADPYGEVVAKADQDETILIATLERDKVEEARRVSLFLRDRRPDSYSGLLTRQLAAGTD